ncbi:uncharacterized protein PHACADRAFT_250564 [Phanerochaete carnosa HHB-10118-sp]|uniref:Uncharacterized protein n=1 Tax=Phanerochaete carnosa (strain HHB-10118-sp) TaxID=650164 RepID=K5XAA4_PHACS|nr:uncharacterized protein PHACADRAFT_250564 [Phanerochaete carnosa HHB-10118-sp]EKM59832.1 hypothetical protein PHACADRAFT_250564 [Phanerochaete carnosa HHB-10118-sp]
MAENGQPSTYACKCLNVRIHAQAPPGPPQEPPDGSHTPVYVGEDGVSVAHIQLTLRNKGPRTERRVGDRTEAVRVVSLTCLVCESLVYRISQVVLPDVESGEGLVLPTDEWVEKEVLRSADGWIEISADALLGTAIEEAEASPQYSKIFGIVLPSGELPVTKDGHAFLSPSQSARPSSPEIPETILPHLPDLFPPPPFTPTHPVFTHLSSCAATESERLRAEGEAHMRQELQKTIAAIQAEEATLKQSVEQLWAKFKGVVQKFEEEDASAPPRLRLKTRRSSSRGRGPAASVRVTNFVPTPSPPPRQSRPSAAAQSALSASLATSNLQSVMGHRQREPSPPSTSSRSPTQVARTDSPSTASSKTLGMPINGEAEIREAYRRNMDESLDVATSFKYMTDLSQHIDVRPPPSVAEEPEEEESYNEVPSPSTSAVPRGRSPRAGKSAIKKPKSNGDIGVTKEPGSPVLKESPPKEHTTPTKGKRKVTFDVKPDVAIIADATPKLSRPKTDRPEEEVFDMEGETVGVDTDTSAPVSLVPPQQELPVQEPIRLARRPHRFRQTGNSGLPSSLSSLRPASLPAPSAMRRIISLDKADGTRLQNIRESVLSPPGGSEDIKRRDVAEEVRDLQEEDEDENADPREAEILRLVAASMPSHRSAWRKDSSAWRTFVNRQKHDSKHKAIPEEDESSAADSSAAEGSAYYDESTDSSNPDEESRVDGGTVMAKSLPIPIGPLGLPPLRKNTNTAESMGKVSAEAMRRASYRERDRMRSIDPGTLDFDFEDDVEDELGSLPEKDDQAAGKSMQRALNILQKHSEIPGAGMWRSLA